ncbi:MAG TPA: glycosyltransferase, partial [Phycisphaerales bacterium]|nr:glycosyltransferase [Phycisphaerales bacterium]
EYSLNTRKQIIRAQTRNKLLRLRRSLWSANQERRNVAAVRLAAGVQCNGTPTFNAYAPLNSNCMLYFDTRVSSDMLIQPSALETRLADLSKNQPLRLAFSGRLNHMKGADHLPLIAAEIRRLSIPFTLDICGAGLLESSMRAKVAELNVQDSVRFRGVLDFKSQLMPFISNEIDLFLCPHRQGDPSCTYLETLSCGVPIVGYDNEAFTGICSMADIGWTSTMDSPIKIAHVIARLHADRAAVAAASREAVAFASRHTFENTMSKRINHLYHCIHMAPLAPAR